MADVRTAHTAYLEPSVLRAARALLDDVFAGEMTDADWEHALGGIHAVAWEDGTVIGHGSVIQRRLWLGGRALRTVTSRGSACAPTAVGAVWARR